mmetsp:Transcript_43332/g.97822  ORF Transcript_43332/g.97822 Transcript_43332/m.97822 type:complete len:238 (-) Transcript_43332:455-1168(-)
MYFLHGEQQLLPPSLALALARRPVELRWVPCGGFLVGRPLPGFRADHGHGLLQRWHGCWRPLGLCSGRCPHHQLRLALGLLCSGHPPAFYRAPLLHHGAGGQTFEAGPLLGQGSETALELKGPPMHGLGFLPHRRHVRPGPLPFCLCAAAAWGGASQNRPRDGPHLGCHRHHRLLGRWPRRGSLLQKNGRPPQPPPLSSPSGSPRSYLGRCRHRCTQLRRSGALLDAECGGGLHAPG